MLACAGLLFGAGDARAVDGVIEINDTSILAAGGYPFAIPATGSYVLTGNLTPPVGVGAITVAAPGVELDLNGFSITGGGGAAVPGIVGGPPGLVVRGGSIVGFSGPGISVLGPESKVIETRIVGNGGGGVVTAINCLLLKNVITGNGGGPGAFVDYCKLENNVIVGNGGPGILGTGNLVLHNRIADNVGNGVGPTGDSLIAENTIAGNGLDGILCLVGSCTIRANVITLNGDDGAEVGPGSSVTENNVSDNTDVGLVISPLAGYSNNTMATNGGVEVAPAAHPTDAFFNICDGAAC